MINERLSGLARKRICELVEVEKRTSSRLCKEAESNRYYFLEDAVNTHIDTIKSFRELSEDHIESYCRLLSGEVTKQRHIYENLFACAEHGYPFVFTFLNRLERTLDMLNRRRNGKTGLVKYQLSPN